LSLDGVAEAKILLLGCLINILLKEAGKIIVSIKIVSVILLSVFSLLSNSSRLFELKVRIWVSKFFHWDWLNTLLHMDAHFVLLLLKPRYFIEVQVCDRPLALVYVIITDLQINVFVTSQVNPLFVRRIYLLRVLEGDWEAIYVLATVENAFIFDHKYL